MASGRARRPAGGELLKEAGLDRSITWAVATPAKCRHLRSYGLQHTDDCAVRTVDSFVEPAQAVQVSEEFVGVVDEVNDQFHRAMSSRLVAYSRRRCINSFSNP